MDELHFSIEGEFITNVARSWFWDEDKHYENRRTFDELYVWWFGYRGSVLTLPRHY